MRYLLNVVRVSLYSKLRVLVLGFILGFSYTGEAIAHGLAHSREIDHHSQHDTQAVADGATRANVRHVEAPESTHTDQTLEYSEGVRVRIGMLPAVVCWEPQLIIGTINAYVPASLNDVKAHPRRGPPPRLRAPPAA